MTSAHAPIIRDHPAALVTALTVTVLGVLLSIAIAGAAAMVLAALLVDYGIKSITPLHDRSPKAVDALLTLLAIAAAGGLIGLGAWFV